MCRSTDKLVTPGTDRSKSGTGSPSARKYGSTQPPMHASTWHRTPRAAAAAAMGTTGSTTPCAYDGALTTTSTVRSSIAAAIAAGSAVNGPASTGTVTASTSK